MAENGKAASKTSRTTRAKTSAPVPPVKSGGNAPTVTREKPSRRKTRGTPAEDGHAPKRGRAARRPLFEPVAAPTRVDYPLLEESVQNWWDEHNILHKYLHRNDAAAERWSFIDGPITANNPMGV